MAEGGDDDRRVDHAASARASPDRGDDGRAFGGARPRRRASSQMLDEGAQLGEQRQLAGRLDALSRMPSAPWWIVTCSSEPSASTATPSSQKSSTGRSDRRPARNLHRMPPAVAAEDAAQQHRCSVAPLGDRRFELPERAEDLEPDRGIVRARTQTGSASSWELPPTRRVRIPETVPSRRSRRSRASSSTAGWYLLVHHEKRCGARAAPVAQPRSDRR